MKHLSYISSTIFFLALLFSLYEGYLAIAAYFFVIAWVMFCSIAVAVPLMIGLKVWAIYQVDVRGLAPVKKVSARRAVVKG
jgi:hypothetical protein